MNAARRRALLLALESRLGDRVEVAGANAGVHVVAWLRDRAAADLPELVRRIRGASPVR
jgi:GntR family transcriptional regulator/MocR family aminotransferase